MTELLVLTAADVRATLDPTALRSALADGFTALTNGAVDVPPRVGARSPDGLLGAMPGYVAGAGLAIKIVTVFPSNHARGMASHQGVVILVDAHHGTPLAVIDATAITETRTSVAAALAADLLARPDAAVLTIIGAGVQARGHLLAFASIRRWSQVRLANRTPEHAHTLATGHPNVTVYESIQHAVEGADVVALCTDATQPVIETSWLTSGAHLSSVGSGHELPADAIATGRVIVEWSGAATNPPPAGAAELQTVEPSSLVELGEIIGGDTVGRRNDDELTIYKSTGHALEDVVAARIAYDRAVTNDHGTTITI